MKNKFSPLATLSVAFALCVSSADGMPATPSSTLIAAQKQAESEGYIFTTSHDAIVAKAKQEGELRVLTTMDSDLTQAMIKAFNEEYPFIKISFADLGSVQDAQRFLLELKAGRGNEWDVARLYTEFYEDYLPFQKKFDILGMAKHEVLNIPRQLIDPKFRNVVTISSNVNVVAYNKNLIPENKVPNRWEDFLKPEFKGRKFAADIRPIPLAVLVPAWGLEKVLSFAREIAAQDPIWVRGHNRNITSVLAGEYPLFLGPNFGSTKRVQSRDKMGVLGYKVLEPVPVRLHEGYGVMQSAKNPYAGLLWLEFKARPEGQKFMDKYWPFGWNHYKKLDDYMKKIVAAYGFPQEQKK